MVQVLQEHILLLRDAYNLLFEKIIVKKFAHLESDLGIFVRIERSNPGFCRTERLSSQPFLLVSIKILMVGHHHLSPVGNKDFRSRDSTIHD